MKRSLKITLAAALAAGLAATAYAHGPFGGMPGQMGYLHGGPMFGDPAARADERLAYLKGQLSITPAQEPKWQPFADAVKQRAQSMVAMRASMQSPAGTTTERMDQHIAFMKLGLENMQAVDNAAKQLYAVLSTEQKTTFDQVGPGAGFGPGRGFGPGHFGPGRFAPRQG